MALVKGFSWSPVRRRIVCIILSQLFSLRCRPCCHGNNPPSVGKSDWLKKLRQIININELLRHYVMTIYDEK